MARIHLKDQAKILYLQSDNIAELEEMYESLKNFVSMPVIKKTAQSDPDRNLEFMISESMLIQLGAKINVLKYARGFTETDYKVLEEYIAENIEIAENPTVEKVTASVNEAGETVLIKTHAPYTKAVRLLANIRDWAADLHVIVRDAGRDMDSITYEGDRATHDMDKVVKILDNFNKRLVEIENLPFAMFPPECVIPDVTAIARDALISTANKIRAMVASMEMGQMKELLGESASPITSAGGISEILYYDNKIAKSKSSASTFVISTPFEDEAMLCALATAEHFGIKMMRLSLSALSGRTADEISFFFDVLSAERGGFLITNIAELKEEKLDRAMIGIMRAGMSGSKMLVVDKVGDRTLFERFEELAEKTEGLSTIYVSHEFLKMPHCAGALSLLVEKGIINNTEEDYARVKKKLPFMGYIGLNDLLSGEQFAIVETRSNQNRPLGVAYLSRLVTQSHLIDSDWGDFSKHVRFVEGERVVFDYDGFKPLDRQNIRAIIEKPGLSIFAKCGIAVKYCILAGDHFTAWERLDDAEKTERVNLATSVVSMLLNNAYAPKVEIFSVEEWREKAKTDASYSSTTVGLCINKGKLIHYRSDYLTSIHNCIRIICHECFHAFQHTAVDNKHAQWHFIELGVTEGRVDAWSKNFDKYIKSGDGYFVEIVEADAEAFAYDCFRGEEGHWQDIDFNYYTPDDEE